LKTASALLKGWLAGNRYGLTFDGSSYVEVADAAGFHLSRFSVEFWANPTFPDSTQRVQISRWNQTGNQRSWAVSFAATRQVIAWSSVDGAAFISQATSALLTLGRPNHIVVTFDGATQIVYVNKAPYALVAGAVPWAGSNSPLWLARDGADGLGSKALGTIAGPRLYARILSQDDVNRHYDGNFGNEAGLQLWLPGAEGSGTVIGDASGNGRDGAITGATWAAFSPYPGIEHELAMADLYTFTLVDGTVVRYTSLDQAVKSGGNTFMAGDVQLVRSNTSVKLGLEVDTLTIKAYASAGNLLQGVAFLKACMNGALDGAAVLLERAFLVPGTTLVVGTVLMFSGRVSDIDPITRTMATIKVKSELELLNIKLPRNVYQPGCLHTLYDSACTVKRANHAVGCIVSSGSSASAVRTDAAQASGYFDLGAVKFVAYLSLPGTSGNYASTPDSAALTISGDLDVRVKLAADDWTPAVAQVPIAIDGGNDGLRSWFLQFDASGLLSLLWTTNGLLPRVQATSTVAVRFTDGQTNWIRATLDVNNGAGGWTVRFYTSSDGETWTQLGTDRTGVGVTSLFDAPSKLTVGAWGSTGGISMMAGKVFYAEVRNGIDGPIVASFDPTSDEILSATSLRSAKTGEVWTINQSGGTPAQVNGTTLRGVTRSVKSYSSVNGEFTLINPLPSAPAAGDALEATPGCDKQQATCGVTRSIAFTADPATDVLSATAHGRSNGEAVNVASTGTLPGGLAAATQYFVRDATADTLKLAATLTGAAIDITSAGSGTHRIVQSGKFANLVNFRGYPYIPAAETAL
jgi:hypothetical protein